MLPLARGRTLELHRPVVMGILNVTPDSFSDGGDLEHKPALHQRIAAMHAAGVDVFDIGGESTRPGHAEVSIEEETARVLPAIAAVRQVVPEAVISIDTRKATVAEAALHAGADMINDVSGMGDPAMASVVRDAGCAYVLMRHEDLSGDVVSACREELARRVHAACEAGVGRAQLVVDPGLGFGALPGADPSANLRLLADTSAWDGGLPSLVGASRKRFIGALTGEPEPKRRLGGSVAAALLAVQGGANIVRVHDVAETVQALRVYAPMCGLKRKP